MESLHTGWGDSFLGELSGWSTTGTQIFWEKLSETESNET